MSDVHTNDLVTKSNRFIEANYKLGAQEQKVILLLASKIQPSDDDFKPYTFSIKEFAKLINVKGEYLYSDLRKITLNLLSKPFEIFINDTLIQTNWLMEASYRDGTVSLKFNSFLKPYLLQLKREFTSYRLSNIVTLKSAYSIRLYELLKQYETIGTRSFDLATIRKVLGVEDIYPVYANFKNRVIIPAQKELAKKTDISFEFTEEKAGRKVNKLVFKIFPNHQENRPTSTRRKSANNSPKSKSDPSQQSASQLPTFIDHVTDLCREYGFDIDVVTIKSWEPYGIDQVSKVLKEVYDKRDDIIFLTPEIRMRLSASKKETKASKKEKTTDSKKIKASKKAKATDSKQIEKLIDAAIEETLKAFMRSTEVVSKGVVKGFFIDYVQEKIEMTYEDAKKIFMQYEEALMTKIRENTGIKNVSKRTRY
ncbi:replication initiation protein [Brevibacillus laterosporus]|uniref:replication initiation protein n=1 Tax=Brevibacillus laterosporus TaxID=1465 RepID=UPI00112B7500|nr:replication initiation protein [Brevibacillus laterosporus]MED1790979.1 replication initiation protein [Brevibacillus laterosporus]MED4762063.1 replication initiation protein [Brevibacillus laterosporus]TPH09925.1 RepB family plasmid replication initiator protein [Brevibacillus laterosporus]